MIGLLMAVSLVGTVILTGICAPLLPPSVPSAPYSFEQTAGPGIPAGIPFGFPAISDTFSQDAEVGHEMQSDPLKDQARLWIVEKSVRILREHRKSEEEIRSIIISDFRIDKETLNAILNKHFSEHSTAPDCTDHTKRSLRWGFKESGAASAVPLSFYWIFGWS